jgi:type I restriction enzyme S subunit
MASSPFAFITILTTDTVNKTTSDEIAIGATNPCTASQNTSSMVNNNLEQQAKALYKDWFFDFSPFSSDGNLPNGWHIGTVGDIIQLHDSKRVPLSGAERDKMAKVYPYYGATSLMDYVDNYLFDGIYLLLGEDGTVVDSLGFPILQYVYGQFWVNNHTHIITGKEGFSVEELYLFFSLTNIKSIVTGAVQQKVSQQNLKKVPAIIPSKQALSAFDEIIQPIFAQIRNLRDENVNLSQLRDTLLPKLMSGELDVSDIDL